MTGPFADRLFRITFALAGCYNLAFGLWAAVWPLAFFHVFSIPPPRYPGIWACLGMVVGVYGLLYWHAAWKLEAAWPIIAVGLLGKVLGPIGMVTSFSDDWPRRLGMICVYNDLIWWLPFGLFLIRGTPFGRRVASLAPWQCVVTHVTALAMLAVVLQPGTLAEPDLSARATYIASRATGWTIGWSTWILAAVSLVGFYAWWGSRLSDRRTNIAIFAVVITAFGMVCDFTGEGALILLLVDRLANTTDGSFGTPELARAANIERAFTLLSAGAANGLYTVGGIMLTLITPSLPKWVRALMWVTWFAGIGMTAAAIANNTAGMLVSTAVLFPSFLVWVAWMGAKWRRCVRQVIALGGLGFFGRAAAAQLRKLGVHVRTASRGSGADLRIDANDPDSIRAAVRPGNIVLDAAGPFHSRTLALVESAICIGFDVVDLNDDLQYAEAVLSLEPQIAEAGIRVLCSASTVSAFSAAVMQIIGTRPPRRFTSFLVPATRHTANPGTAMSMLRTVGRPIRVVRDGELRTVTGWHESRSIPLPSPLRPIRGRVFESADALWLPRICPSLNDVAMYVDANALGVNTMLALASYSNAVRRVMQSGISLGTWMARRFGSEMGGVAYELEGVDGRVGRFALIAEKNSYLVAIAPAVLAVKKMAGDQLTERGLLLPDRYVEPLEILRFLDAMGVKYFREPGVF